MVGFFAFNKRFIGFMTFTCPRISFDNTFPIFSLVTHIYVFTNCAQHAYIIVTQNEKANCHETNFLFMGQRKMGFLIGIFRRKVWN